MVVFNMVGSGGGKTSLAGAIITLGPTLIFNGTAQTQTLASVILNGVALIVGDDYTISGNIGTNAGSYDLVITGCNNFEGTATKAWTISKASLAKPTVASSPAYTGAAIDSPLSGYDDTKMSMSGDTSATTVGTYAVYVNLRNTSNYQWSDGSTGQLSLSWHIVKASLPKPTVSGAKTYTGSAQTVTLSGYDSNTMSLGGAYSATNAGTYTATVALLDTANYQWVDGTTSTLSLPWTINKAAGSLSISPAALTLNASSPSGTITVTRAGNGTISAVSSDTSVATVSVNGNVVTVNNVNQKNGSATITISVAAGTNHNAPADKTCAVTASFIAVYGVSWAYNNSSTALARLTAANDPNGYVSASVATEPSPAVGTGAGSSPFDSLMPWSGMDEFNVISNAISYQRGHGSFSRTAYDTVVRIPKFWYKIVTDATNSKMMFYLADGAADGFSVHPAFLRGDGVERDYIYVGRYHTISGYYSKSGAKPLASIDRPAARSGSANKGTPWWLYDLAALNAIQLLYLIEFADWDSQAKIGRGNVDSGTVQNNGGTDSMVYHTGRASGTDGSVQAQYRHLEEIWGNVRDWCDGCNFNAKVAYVCTNPSKFDDDTATNYTAVNLTLPASGYIKRLSASTVLPWVLLPTESGGSETTYVPDYVSSSTGGRTLNVGGSYSSGSSAGLFYFGGNNSSSSTSASLGARLLFLP